MPEAVNCCYHKRAASFELLFVGIQVNAIFGGYGYDIFGIIHVAYFLAFKAVHHVVSHLTSAVFHHFVPKDIGFFAVFHYADILRLCRSFSFYVVADGLQRRKFIVIVFQRVNQSPRVFQQRFGTEIDSSLRFWKISVHL